MYRKIPEISGRRRVQLYTSDHCKKQKTNEPWNKILIILRAKTFPKLQEKVNKKKDPNSVEFAFKQT